MLDQNHWLLRNAIVAAIYAALTIGLSPLSYGPVQVRFSECLTLLAFYNPRWIPGLTIGCFLANMGSPLGLPDMLIGTLATFLGIFPMRYMKNSLLASLLPVLSNGVLIGAELAAFSQLPPDLSVGAAMLYIGAGELLSVTVLGTIVMRLLLNNDFCKTLLCG